MGLNLIQKLSLNLFLFVSIAISPIYNIDSISLPKFVLLTTYGFIGIIYIIFNITNFINRLNLTAKLISLGFLFCITLSFFGSQSPKVQLLFGRDGRYNGALTFISLVILFLISTTIKLDHLSYLLRKIFISITIITVYAIFQLLNLDPIKWDTVNVQYFGTFGNPNFLSSFLAISVIPTTMLIFKKIKKENIVLRAFFFLIIYVIATYMIHRTYSIQGFVVLMMTNFIWLILWLYSKYKFKTMYLSIFIAILASYIGLIGSLNRGPFASILYKSSLTSRGDFFRSATSMTKDNWISGVGPDSFGDYYLKYRDVMAANRLNPEIADSAHNYFLDLSANLGIFMLFFYSLMVVLTVIVFIKLYKTTNFNDNLLVLFTIWLGLIIQSLISPLNLTFLTFIFLFSGLAIGNWNHSSSIGNSDQKKVKLNWKYPTLGGLLCAFLVLNPIVQRDHKILLANNSKRLDLLLLALEQYPRSTTSYNKALVILNNQGDEKQSLILARKAAEFNNRSSAAHLFIFQNSLSSDTEKSEALKKLIALDPNNKYFEQFLIK